MSKHEAIIASLSTAAKSAIHTASGSHVGAKCEVDPLVRTELVHDGLIGWNDGLTILGANVRTVYMRQLEDELFPL